MSPNLSLLRIVGSLNEQSFFIPKYQRGYRWETEQVRDLLEDVWSFLPKEKDGETTWYCLQPLVVWWDKDMKKYHLIDGQQRLTTIYLILHYINSLGGEQEKLFDLSYETRKSEWVEILNDKNKAEENIDFCHIYNAYQTIKKWFSTMKEKDATFRSGKFRDRLLTDCRFIWYDIAQNGHSKVSKEDVFIRLNIGKIPLTDAELIKALFLNSSNFGSGTNEEEITLRQQEIAIQWDAIEEELTNDEFWYFINGRANSIAPRIEYLFNIIPQNGEKPCKENRSIFRVFQSRFDKIQKLKNKKEKIKAYKEEWEEVYKIFCILKEWYLDNNYYHLIGYIVCAGIHSISEMLDINKGNNKDKFDEKIKTSIKTKINWNGIDSISYGDYKIKNILLLHNIITLCNLNNERTRFPFDKYLKENWDIEHIHAHGDKTPNAKLRKEWLKEIIEFITDEDLSKKAESFNEFENNDAFDELYRNIEDNLFSEKYDEAENLISNLTLLDAGTNRGYGCSPFAQKRKVIIEKDKDGKFIPVCTKNVFQKYYSKEHPPQMTLWGEQDKTTYLEDIKATLKEYLSE